MKIDMDFVTATPRKKFFIDLFTRDISLEDCILDLVDNSIDGLVRSKDIHPADSVFQAKKKKSPEKIPLIKISISEMEIRIQDECGGIPKDVAKNEAFNFGRLDHSKHGELGVYGIGLKRAIFKMGDFFKVESKTKLDNYYVSEDIVKWAGNDDSNPDNWRFPLVTLVKRPKKPYGTTVTITRLKEDVKRRIGDPSFLNVLKAMISKTYPYLLESEIRVLVNGVVIHPEEIPIAHSSDIKVGIDRFKIGNTNVSIIVGLARKEGVREVWTGEKSGWYILCNGRVVVRANKDEETGWGIETILPKFQPKHRGFVGIVFLNSKDGLELPWKTTKRGLNQESKVYQITRQKMADMAKPIITFINNLYPSDNAEIPLERKLADSVKEYDLSKLPSSIKRTFEVDLKKGKIGNGNEVKIQFWAEKSDVEKVRKYLRDPKISAQKLGKLSFDYYVKNVCGD